MFQLVRCNSLWRGTDHSDPHGRTADEARASVTAICPRQTSEQKVSFELKSSCFSANSIRVSQSTTFHQACLRRLRQQLQHNSMFPCATGGASWGACVAETDSPRHQWPRSLWHAVGEWRGRISVGTHRGVWVTVRARNMRGGCCTLAETDEVLSRRAVWRDCPRTCPSWLRGVSPRAAVRRTGQDMVPIGRGHGWDIAIFGTGALRGRHPGELWQMKRYPAGSGDLPGGHVLAVTLEVYFSHRVPCMELQSNGLSCIVSALRLNVVEFRWD